MNMQEYLKQHHLGDHFFEYLKQQVRTKSREDSQVEHWEDMVTLLYASSQTELDLSTIRMALVEAKKQSPKLVREEKKTSQEALKESIKVQTDLCETFLESFAAMEDETMYAIVLQKAQDLHHLLKLAHPDQTYQVKDLVQIASRYVNHDPEAFYTLCKTECDHYRYSSLKEAIQQPTYQEKAMDYCLKQYFTFSQKDPSLTHAKLDQVVAGKTLRRNIQTLSEHFARPTNTKGGTSYELKKIKGTSIHL